jgi:hypothetical protein
MKVFDIKMVKNYRKLDVGKYKSRFFLSEYDVRVFLYGSIPPYQSSKLCILVHVYDVQHIYTPDDGSFAETCSVNFFP